ncbi:hypothetical protein STEG23_004975, partial [Scotinomys teguina]
ARGIVISGLIPSLVWNLQSEEEHIQEIILDTLALCLQEDATQALDSHAVPRLKEKLLSENSKLRGKAARALIAISIPVEGKNQVWQNDVIPILVNLLMDPEEEVQANAAGALMHATVTTEGDGTGTYQVNEQVCMRYRVSALDTAALETLTETCDMRRALAALNVSIAAVLVVMDPVSQGHS